MRLLLLFLCIFCLGQTVSAQETAPQLQTIYDSKKDMTIVRLSPVRISGAQAQYHSIHVSPSFSYAGHTFKKPEVIDFEVQTVVKTKLKIDLYVVFVVDDETIFLSSNRWAVKRPVAGKRWIGERLVFRMPYDTLMKITKAKSVEIKMDGVRFPLSESSLEQVRKFAQRVNMEVSLKSQVSRLKRRVRKYRSAEQMLNAATSQVRKGACPRCCETKLIGDYLSVLG